MLLNISMTETKKPWCVSPWVSKFITTDGKIQPCCMWQYNVPYDENQVKKTMLLNGPAEGCKICTEYEKSGLPSFRQTINHQFNNLEFQRVELAVDNVCNLECLMCGSYNSHKAAKREQTFLGDYLSKSVVIKNKIYQELDWSTVKSIRFYGGEPFYSPGIEDFLTWIENKINWKEIDIIIPTNSTVWPSRNMIKVLKQAKSVSLLISLDGWGEINNYQRQGSVKFDEIFLIMKKWQEFQKDHTHIDISINSTVTVINALAQDELSEKLHQYFPEWYIHREMCITPAWFNLQNMPDKLKKHYMDNIKNEQIKIWLQEDGNTTYFGQLSIILNYLDNFYKNDLSEINQVLKQYLNQQNSNVEDIKEYVRSIAMV
jgi:sulfatase maturation enzyme AslB (radical SAM superfamily)